jgi:acyl-CoA reductase-like NAD-dependent aldehyde dehydrogenase
LTGCHNKDAVVDAFIRSASELKLGDGLDETATLCPVVNRDEEKRIRAAIERGVTEGARLRLDGRSRTAPHRPRGCFIGPTVFDDVTPEMFVGREEIFGPVVSVMRAPDLDNARSKSGGESPLSEPDGTVSAIQVLHDMRQHSEAILIEKRTILILI